MGDFVHISAVQRHNLLSLFEVLPMKMAKEKNKGIRYHIGAVS